MHHRLVAAALAATSLLALPAAAPAASKTPYLKVDTIAVNRWTMTRGAKVTADDGTNACYQIAGPAGTPQNLSLFGFVTARNIPRSAPAKLVWTAPWHQPGQPLEKDATVTGTFAKVLSKVRGERTRFERYTMAPVPTSSTLVDGAYGMKLTVTVNGKRLTSAVSATVDCL